MVTPTVEHVCSMATVNEIASFTVKEMVHGYHEYCDVLDAVLGEELPYRREPGNPHDPCAVAIMFQENYHQFAHSFFEEVGRSNAR